MHDVISFFVNILVQISVWTSDLAGSLGALTGHAPQKGELAMAAIVTASVLLCIAGCAWALIERGRVAAAKYMMSGKLARAQAEIRFREAMIAASPEAIVVMGADMAAPLSYRGGSALLQASLAGPDSVALAARLKNLLEGGVPFALAVHTATHPAVAVQGCVIGSRAAIFLRVEEGASELERDLKAIVDAMAVPVWIRNRAMSLTWANRAFLAATGAGTLENALHSGPRLIRAERDLVGAVLEGHDVLGERRYTVVGGRRRALSVDLQRLPSSQVAGVALDVTESAQAEAQLKLGTDAYADVMDRIEAGVAVFGADRRLAFFNSLFARMWGLCEGWLATHPTLDDIIDRLRETRRLPEQRDFQAWKRAHLELFESDNGRIEEAWHIPGGNSFHVRAYPYLLGGVFYVFEDISEMLKLNASHHMMSQIQRATLDTLPDAMAVFGPNGRLKIHNAAFAQLWRLNEDDLVGEPHLAKIASLCGASVGRDGIWSMVSSAIASTEPARYGDWGRLARADGRVLSLSLTRLPLGATLVNFEDETDVERFAAAIAGEAAESNIGVG